MTLKDLIESDRFDELIAAIEGGAAVDTGDRRGTSALMRAICRGNTEAARRFVALGADVNGRDRNGWTALHFAAQEGLIDGASLLLSHGATVDARDRDGNSPLWRAVMSCREEALEAIVAMLLQAGADPDLSNLHGVSPREITPALFALPPASR